MTNHRKYYDRAHFLFGRLRRVAEDVLALWPVDAGQAIRVGDGPEGLHEICVERDALADSVILFSAMSVEAFINYYGVVRLGERQFTLHCERLPAERKLRLLLLICDGLELEPKDPLIAALLAVVRRRNALAHPKAKEVSMDFAPQDEPGQPLVEIAADALGKCTEFFRLFEAAVPEASHFMPQLLAT